MRKAIFLDRDGIINRAEIIKGKPYPPLRMNAVHLMKGIENLIKIFKKKGFLVIGITNQPDVANNIVSKRQIQKINEYIKTAVHLDDIYVCYHNDKDNCECRKPKPGLLLQAGEKYQIDFSESFMIGDRWKDVEAGKAVGCKTIFVDYEYDEARPEHPDFIVNNILEIEDIIEEKC